MAVNSVFIEKVSVVHVHVRKRQEFLVGVGCIADYDAPGSSPSDRLQQWPEVRVARYEDIRADVGVEKQCLDCVSDH